MAYEILPTEYDLLTRDVLYQETARWVRKILVSRQIESGIVLDLACGTGSLSYLIADMGYEVIGVDVSSEMLAVAYSKRAAEQTLTAPVFVQQDMRELDLYGTVDACICMLDSVNYITEPADLRKVFQRVFLFLNPGGVLLFDINTPKKLREMDGCTFCDEDEENGVFCVWRTALTDRPKVYQFLVDLFQRKSMPKGGETWKRGSEEHYEYAYEPEELRDMLRDCGFTEIETSGDLQRSAPGGDEKRLYFTAIKPK